MKNKDIEKCEFHEVHLDLVSKIKKNQPNVDLLYDLAELFKVFGDSTRIRILSVLMEEELCVCDICETLQMSQSAVSHQLRVLKNAKLIRNRKDGKQVFYKLSDEHVRTILAMALEHIEEE